MNQSNKPERLDKRICYRGSAKCAYVPMNSLSSLHYINGRLQQEQSDPYNESMNLIDKRNWKLEKE